MRHAFSSVDDKASFIAEGPSGLKSVLVGAQLNEIIQPGSPCWVCLDREQGIL
jgi:hypothetical protein